MNSKNNSGINPDKDIDPNAIFNFKTKQAKKENTV